MQRLAILIALGSIVAGCHKKGTTPTSGSGSGSDDSSPVAKRLVFAFGVSPNGKSADVFLASTDERGAQVSRALGTYPGTCAPATAAPEMGALIALDCKDGATGIELQVIDRRDRVLVLKLRIDDGVKPDPMARDQIAEVEVPVGAGIEAAK